MTATSEPPSVAGVAAGIADADRVGASVTAQAANPINKSRFILVSPPWIRGIATERQVSVAPRVPRPCHQPRDLWSFDAFRFLVRHPRWVPRFYCPAENITQKPGFRSRRN